MAGKTTSCAIVALAMATLCGPALAEDYKYTRLKVPGSVETKAIAVNDTRQVTGTYKLPNGKVRMFVWSDGTFKTYKAPAPHEDEPIVPVGISPLGYVAGSYGDKKKLPFELKPGADAVETIYIDPTLGWSDVTPTTVSRNSNPESQFACGHLNGGDGIIWGFMSVPDNFYRFYNDPARVTIVTDCDIVDAEPRFGLATGNMITDRQHAYEWASTLAIDPPGSIETWSNFINSKRDLGGHAFDKNRKKFGWVRREGVFTKYKYPGNLDTGVTDSLGEVVFGEFTDKAGKSHAFLFKNEKYKEVSLDWNNVTLKSVGYDGSFVGTFKKGGKTFGYIATCEAGPGKCKP